jgi:hypothetical protein
MKTTITIEGSSVKVSFTPENELEKMCLRELGEDVSVSRCHQDLVLRQRRGTVRNIVDAAADYDATSLPGASAASM